MKLHHFLTAFILLLFVSVFAQAQQNQLPQNATLQECIEFALKNGAAINIFQIDEKIGEKQIASSLSNWYPQLNMSANYTHNIKIPSTIIGDQLIYMGQKNTSAVMFQADQQLLNSQLIHASKSGKLIREINRRNTEENTINTVVAVSKAYYDILTTNEQLKFIQANIERLEKQFADATERFNVGLVDQTDFKRAKIALSNSKADQKRSTESLKFKYALLKDIMGLAQNATLTLSFDETDMESQISLDVPEYANTENRIEFQLLNAQKRMQELNTKFSKLDYLPALSAFVNYAWDWRSNPIKELYDKAVPRSVFGVNFAFNIFDGNRKLKNLRVSQLMEKRIDWSITDLKNKINTEYQLALASYNSSVNDWQTAKENMEMSQDVYDVIKLQYDSGIKTYLELMTADTDLKSAQINYLNALFALLSAKLDVEKAMGTISSNYSN